MQTFHIVLTALMAFGTLNYITTLAMFPNILGFRFKAFDYGMLILIWVSFYAIAAYAISTNNFALYWTNVIVNTGIGIWNGKRMMNRQGYSLEDMLNR
jgi:hypothetical protein